MDQDAITIAEQIGRLSVTGLLVILNYVQWKQNEKLRAENNQLQDNAIKRAEEFTAKSVELITEVKMMFQSILNKS